MTAFAPVTEQAAGQPLIEQVLAAVKRVRSLLEAWPKPENAEEPVEASATAPAGDSALSRLAARFSLSDFETEALVFCAAVELDPQVPSLLEAVQGPGRHPHPTFQLLLNIVPGAHWSAILPQRPLRRWRLVEFRFEESLTASPLRIDETVLHFLMGVPVSDERLQDAIEKVPIPEVLPPSYRPHAERIVQVWKNAGESRIVIQLAGDARKGKLALAAAACAASGMAVRCMSAQRLPGSTGERESFLRLLERDAVLNEYVLLIDAEDAESPAWNGASYLANRFDGRLIVLGTGGLNSKSREVVTLRVDKPTTVEQSSLWHYALGEHAAQLNGDLDHLSQQFSLDLASILSSAQHAIREVHQSGGELGSLLWEACRAQSRPALDYLAQRIETRARWKDIVLPDACMDTLRTIVFQMRQRNTVLHRWGFADRCSRGLGTAALFHGPSGSGKTLAAEILGNELSLDLFHVDLSQIVSKYIGETEKNLKNIFDSAENTGAILLFDEADALFGKRSEVKDSHDRYANIEVSYLLQRMESYRGLAILTTNLRGALDSAFLRRIRFVVHFPFPDATLRRRIWEQMFPAEMPKEGLNFERLARLNLPGGNIRNIALNAAYMAAEKGEPVQMRHLLLAARQECHKLERPLSESEIGGWA